MFDLLKKAVQTGLNDARLEMDDRGQVGFRTVLAVISVFVLAMVGVVVADNLNTSIGTPTNTALSTAQNDILTGYGDMSSLIGVLFIIAIVVVIIFQLRRVQ